VKRPARGLYFGRRQERPPCLRDRQGSGGLEYEMARRIGRQNIGEDVSGDGGDSGLFGHGGTGGVEPEYLAPGEGCRGGYVEGPAHGLGGVTVHDDDVHLGPARIVSGVDARVLPIGSRGPSRKGSEGGFPAV